MSIDLVQSDTLFSPAIPEGLEGRLDELKRWALTAPSLAGSEIAIAAIEHPRRRRVALWELLGRLERSERTETLTRVAGAAWNESQDGLRLLFSFLCGRPATFLYPEQVASLRNLRRVGTRLLFHDAPEGALEIAWTKELLELLPNVPDTTALNAELAKLGGEIELLLGESEARGEQAGDAAARAIALEAQAASIRGARLAASVGDYDTRKLAKLLPLVVALDEWQGDLDALAERGAVALKHPLIQFLGEEETQKWQADLGKRDDAFGALLGSWIGWMRRTEMIGNEPAAWVALLRMLGERSYRRTLVAALVLPQRWREGRLGLRRKPPGTLFPAKALVHDDGLYWVDLSQLRWTEWVSPDGRPASGESWLSADSPLLLLRSRLQDEFFCEMMLGSEEWTQRAGVVEVIARGSRSLRVLLRIARTRKLHSGSANRNVPAALLQNPANIPLSALRAFLNLRYISRHELTRLARGGPETRREISAAARSALRYL